MAYNIFDDGEGKAAYNQSRGITEFLQHLMGSYIALMNGEEYPGAVKCIGRILDIVSAKMKPEEITKADEFIKVINEKIPKAIEKHTISGKVFWTNVENKKEVEKKIIELFRYVNKLQDKYGYGMVSLDDPRFAVLNR